MLGGRGSAGNYQVWVAYLMIWYGAGEAKIERSDMVATFSTRICPVGWCLSIWLYVVVVGAEVVVIERESGLLT